MRSVQKSQIPFFKSKTNFSKIYFFPVVRPEANQVLNVDFSEWLKFLTRIRIRLSQLADHKFRHNF